jgi:protein TonB
MGTHRILVPEMATLRNFSTPAAAAANHNASDQFLTAVLEMPTTNAHTTRKSLKMAASFLIHAGVIAALLVIPVYFAASTISTKNLEPTYVFTPPPVHLAPPPPAAAAVAPRTAPTIPQIVKTAPLVAPREIPKQTAAAASSVQAPVVADDAGLVGGVPGGVPGGVLGGILGSTGPATIAPPTNAHGIVRVGGNVKPPELIEDVQPEYPVIAEKAHVQGTVVIDAVIDTTGRVVSEHAVSGPGLLIPAALAAVQQWRYQPTILNGQPVELAMEVTVSFNLS